MKYRIFSLFYITIVFVTQMAAEDGSHLWLRLPTNARAQVSAPYQSSTLDIAVEEIAESMARSSCLACHTKGQAVEAEGFLLRCKDNTVILSAPTEKGCFMPPITYSGYNNYQFSTLGF